MKSRTIIYCILLVITAVLISLNAVIKIFFLQILITCALSSIKLLVDKIKTKEISSNPFNIFVFIFWFQLANYLPKYASIALSWIMSSIEKAIQYFFSIPPPPKVIDPMPTVLQFSLRIINDINAAVTFKDLEENVLLLICFIVGHLTMTTTCTCGCLMFIKDTNNQIGEEQTTKEKTDTNDSKTVK